MTDLIVDSNALQQLWRAGGVEAWDTMLRGHDNIIILDAVSDEIQNGPHAQDFQDWLTRQHNTGRVQEVSVLSEEWRDKSRPTGLDTAPLHPTSAPPQPPERPCPSSSSSSRPRLSS